LGGLVSLSLVREFGPVLTALLVAGRAGSAIAAEIGAMVATEQLDGLRMMSVDPVDFVGQPKALALTFSMPLLSALFIVFGLGGGYLVGVGLLGIDGGAYITGVERNITFSDEVVGSILKSVVFGMLVALISTWRGFSSAPNAAGVSRATTGAVVQASVATLMFDYVITALWGG
jgi:phospholipid/cholesterol/gamma-HCH transport system permease protein